MSTDVAEPTVVTEPATTPQRTNLSYATGATRALSVLLRVSRENHFTPEQFVAFVERVETIMEKWRRKKKKPTPFVDTAVAEAIKSEAK